MLVDYLWHRNAAKGPGAAIRVALTDADLGSTRPDEDVLAIDEALNAIESIDARVSKVVELASSADCARTKRLTRSACRSRR